jgi:rubrerythrin
MAVKFADSETKINLMRSFAGESQARTRYSIAAEHAREQKHQAIAKVFVFTAEQEREHAEVFLNHLKEFDGDNIEITAGYPVTVTRNLGELLRQAQHGEYEEHGDVYPAFAEKAMEEGYPEIAASFRLIAGIEKTHGDRFGQLAQWIEENKLYVSDVKTGWFCLNCGYIFEGEQVPEKCPVCDHDKGYFIRLELAPYLQSEQ